MIVFSNTTPIIALSSIGQLELLPRLFEHVHVVSAVMEECQVGGPISVPDLRLIDWVVIVEVAAVAHSSVLLELDKGEKHTLDMACKHKADLVIIDEKIGRNMAEYLGLKVTGTLGVLLKAKQLGYIPSFINCVKEMEFQGIFYHPSLIRKLVSLIGESIS
jgi:predicted nucleic acid-binding protein